MMFNRFRSAFANLNAIRGAKKKVKPNKAP
jgi:hypothetical protein